jgi:hypothetical protein
MVASRGGLGFAVGLAEWSRGSGRRTGGGCWKCSEVEAEVGW